MQAAVRAALEMPFSAGIRYQNELHVVCMQATDRLEGIAAFGKNAAPNSRDNSARTTRPCSLFTQLLHAV